MTSYAVRSCRRCPSRHERPVTDVVRVCNPDGSLNDAESVKLFRDIGVSIQAKATPRCPDCGSAELVFTVEERAPN